MVDVTAPQTNTLGYLAMALWLNAESQFNQLQTITTQLGDLMAQVQVDDGVLTNAASSIESLVSTTESLANAVTAFLQSPAAQQLPEGDLTALNTALGDAQMAGTDASDAQTALQNAAGGSTPTPDPDAPTS